jgi:hypothetical protein
MEPMANQVMWLLKSTDGPDAGKHEQLAKCAFKLMDDSPGLFFVFYKSLRSFLGSNGFNSERLPALQHISDALDLTLMRLWKDMPNVGAYKGGKRKPMSDWIEAQNEFSSTFYALFANQGVIGPAATRSCNIFTSYHFSGSGSQVLQDLVCLHHPGHCDTQAPSFFSVKGATPIMPSHVTAGNQLSTLTVYFMAFGNWEAHLKLYPDAKYIRETEYHLLFLEGHFCPKESCAAWLKRTIFLSSKEMNNLVFQRQQRHCTYLPKGCSSDLVPLLHRWPQNKEIGGKEPM